MKKTIKTIIKLPRWFLSKRRRRLFYKTSLVFLIGISIFSYLTNPFVRFSIVKDLYHIDQKGNNLVLAKKSTIKVNENPIVEHVAFVKAGWHILQNRFSRSNKAKAQDLWGIIREIHELRFNPDEPFLISGDHFSMLYPRSFGIFYHSLLDPRTALDTQDWLNRQEIYLKSLIYALDVYSQTEELSTTIVPIGPKSVSLMNIYNPPSDTLYSLLFGLERISSDSSMIERYPFSTNLDLNLNTTASSQILLEEYKPMLARHLAHFSEEIIDPQTGLIKKNLLLSGAKDITKRESAFYDNVIFWKTHELAQKLGIIPKNQQFLDNQKQRIIQTFWDEENGIFLEDLSSASLKNTFYSSDWLIAFMTGMIDPANEIERKYLERSIAYIQSHGIDQPFGVKYQQEDRPYRQYFLVRFFGPAYGGTSIWSNWGMEYIKLLTRLYQITCNKQYKESAEQQLSAYENNIVKYKGYPEVYNAKGEIFRPLLYRSIIQTGWVVSFEQAEKMFEWTKENSCR